MYAVPYLTHQMLLPNEGVVAGCGSLGWQLCSMLFFFNKQRVLTLCMFLRLDETVCKANIAL